MAYNTPTTYQKLSLAAQTTYARLVDLLLASEAGSPVGGASMVSKTIRGHRYWYVQRQEANKRVQAYLGPETPETMAIVERWRRARAEAASRSELVAMARAGGAYVVSAAEARVLEQLSGVFRMGAVLVGSHAFAVLGNLLGVRWQDAIVRTADIDIAHDHRLAVALARDAEPLDLRRVLDDPIPRHSLLNPTDPATSFRVRGAEIEVELLTPIVGRERRRPIHIPALGAAATPLRFLDYLIEETQPGAALGGNGAWVNVPRPGRFAVHKLIVASKRVASSASRPKADKDRAQAGALLRVLLDELPGEISLAWKALAKRGRGWVAPAAQSLARLDPDLVAELSRLGVRPG